MHHLFIDSDIFFFDFFVVVGGCSVCVYRCLNFIMLFNYFVLLKIFRKCFANNI
jgi:hypothetical protein